MQTFPKLYLTGALVLDMVMMNYCYNTYGLSPDYSFFDTDGKTTEYVESVASGGKAQFISNYTPIYDNIISGMAVTDDSLSPGALYYDLRSRLGEQLYIGGVRIRVPGNAEMSDGFEIKHDVNYAGDAEAGKMYKNGEEIAEVRIKNGMFYRISSHDPSFRIGEIHVGMHVGEVYRKWGEPPQEEHPVYRYPAGKRAQVTFIASPGGYITWMLYESMGTELTDKDDGKQTAAERIKTEHTAAGDEREYPVADAVMKLHGRHNGGITK